MRNDFGNRPYSVRFPYGSGGSANGKKRQGYNDRLDESLGARDGKESTKSQSFKAEEMNQKAWRKLWVKELTLLSEQWINNYAKY